MRELEASLNSTRNALSTLSQNAHSPLLSLPDPALQTAYDDLRTLHATVQQTLRERNEEVSSLRTFLTKTDELSGAQLVQATHDLNIEIIQLSASIVDRFAPSFTRKFDFVRQSDRDLLHPALGVRTTQLLEDLQHSADPTFVQYAIQAWQVAFVGKQMSAFCFGAPSEVQRILTAVFQRIQAAEPQATSSRWRALTHSHIRAYLSTASPSSTTNAPPPTPVTPVTPTSPITPAPPTKTSASKLLEAYIVDNLRGVIAIMALAGSEDRNAVHRAPMYEAYGSKLGRILERALHLSTAFRERVMSAAFESVVVPPTGTWLNTSAPKQGGLSLNIPGQVGFDHSTMTSVFGQPTDGEEEDVGNVLCTIELGLACVRKTEAADGPLVSSGKGSRSRSVDRYSSEESDDGKTVTGIQRTNSSTSSFNTPVNVLDRTLLIKPKVMVDSSTLAYLQT